MTPAWKDAVRRGSIDELQRLVAAPGFAGKTAMDLAVARGAREMVDILPRRPRV